MKTKGEKNITNIDQTKIKLDGRFKKIHILATDDLKQKPQLKMAMIPSLFQLCAEGFGITGPGCKEPGFITDVEHHILHEPFMGLVMEREVSGLAPANFKQHKYKRSNRPIAFFSYRLVETAAGETKESKDIVYFSAIMVAREYRGRGIASSIIAAIMRKHMTPWMALRTQNPVMRESVKQACIEVYPDLAGKEIPQECAHIGEAIAGTLEMPGYDKELMTEEGTYGKSLYGETIPILEGDRMGLNAAFWKLVDVHRGDSMIVVGRGVRE